MKLYKKILLTIANLIGLVYLATFFSVDLFRWITNNVMPFEYQNIIINAIYFPSLLYLIHRIWSFKNIEKNIKWNWTLLLIFLNVITISIYIWKKDDILVRQKGNPNS